MSELVMTLLAAAVPFVVSAVTGLVKQLPVFTSMYDSTRTPAVRALAAFISLVTVVLGGWVSGAFDQSVLAASIQALCIALVGWLGSLGVFHAFFAKKE